ncbi:hypothetical protein WS68_01925 [Burkholderia sp. TSV86]|nr:hypothetical protein WS68_01925 [Burkholderia sp. TSV86]
MVCRWHLLPLPDAVELPRRQTRGYKSILLAACTGVRLARMNAAVDRSDDGPSSGMAAAP